MNRDSGSATIYVLAVVALLAFASVPVAAIAIGFAAHRKASLAADLAALGGAQASLDDAGIACSTADRVATANGADLQGCVLSGYSLRVEVTVPTSLVLLPEIGASARAGVRP